MSSQPSGRLAQRSSGTVPLKVCRATAKLGLRNVTADVTVSKGFGVLQHSNLFFPS